MPRVKIGPSAADQETLQVEISRLRDLDLTALRAAWQNRFRRKAPSHVPRHLLLRMLAYQAQADHFGDLDNDIRRLLDGAVTSKAAGKQAVERSATITRIRPGAILTREWNGRMHRVSVLSEGFAWNGQTYPSLSKIASAITGTRWNGPRFFGLRDAAADGARS